MSERCETTFNSGDVRFLPGIFKRLRRRDRMGIAPLARCHTAIVNDLRRRWVHIRDSARPIAISYALPQRHTFHF
jgi:hypothetical protein